MCDCKWESKRGQVYCYLKYVGKSIDECINRAISRGARAPKKQVNFSLFYEITEWEMLTLKLHKIDEKG